MQHLEEGTIHAWLDGALSPEEAAQAEAHVGECSQCAAAVAEARGFIAASSRILTALDNAPRGVLPAQRRAPQRFGPAWKAAAAVMLVAAGSLAIRTTLRTDSTAAERAPAFDTASSMASQASSAAPTATIPKTVAPPPGPGNAGSEVRGKTSPRTPSPPVARSTKAPAPGVAAKSPALAATAPSSTNAQGMSDMNLQAVGAAAGAVCVDCAETRLRVVRVDTTGREKRTIYEVAPNETVTLVEVDSPLVARTALTTKMMSEQPMSSVEAVPSTMDARRGAAAAQRVNAPAPTAPPAALLNQVNTIQWQDAATGKVLRLSGRFPRERLEAIRKQIERERAAKKKP